MKQVQSCEITTRNNHKETRNNYKEMQNAHREAHSFGLFQSGRLAPLYEEWGAFYTSVPRGQLLCIKVKKKKRKMRDLHKANRNKFKLNQNIFSAFSADFGCFYLTSLAERSRSSLEGCL